MDGREALLNGSPGSVQLLADVAGYYVSGTPSVAGAFAALSPARLLDTRLHVGGWAPGAGGVVRLFVAAGGGMRVLTVSGVQSCALPISPSGSGFVTVWSGQGGAPTASN